MLWLAALTAAFGFGAVLAYLNTVTVPVDYLAGRAEAPLVVWLLVSFAMGIGLALMTSLIRGLRARAEVRSLQRRLDRAEAELKTFRGLPLKEI